MTTLPSVITQNLITKYMPQEEIERIMSLDTEACWNEIVHEVTGNAAWIVRVSLLVYRYIESGGSRENLGSTLRLFERVAYGQLHPEALAKFRGVPKILNRLIKLPMLDQERLVSGKVEIVVRRGIHTDFVMRSPDSLSKREVEQLFDSDHIRTREEQAAYLLQKAEATSPEDPFAEACVSIKVMMTQKQRRAIKAKSHQTGLSESEVVIDALRKSGIV